MKASTPYARVVLNLEKTLKRLKVSPRVSKVLHEPQGKFEKDLTITLDNGKKAKFPAFRVQYNNARGPYQRRNPLPPRC